MEDSLQKYRSSLVTAIGIILGFVLGFSATWATQPVTAGDTNWADYIIAVGFFISIIFHIVALYRILSMNYPEKSAKKYYQHTLQLFIW
jgi:ABC-type antimicrobial peptide transport system permease subunit